MTAKKSWVLGADDLATWFLRLNGCLTMVNFVVHGRQRLKPGEFDILAVRFPDRREVLPPDELLDDHPRLLSAGRVDLIIAETTLHDCKLNGPWVEDDGRLRYVLQAIGAFRPSDLARVVADLFGKRLVDGHPQYRIRVFAFGRETDPALGRNVEQFIWAETLAWIYERFDKHHSAKAYHEPWNEVGNSLWDASLEYDLQGFVLAGLRALGVNERYAALDRGRKRS